MAPGQRQPAHLQAGGGGAAVVVPQGADHRRDALVLCLAVRRGQCDEGERGQACGGRLSEAKGGLYVSVWAVKGLSGPGSSMAC